MPQGLTPSRDTPGACPYALFDAFPSLSTAIPRVPLGLWPTPVEELPRIAEVIGSGPVFVKHDDVTALPYGGNKVRKLEILLADALRSGARDLITFGAAGSNHALATAIYGRKLGLEVTSMLTPQPNAQYVRRNLLGHLGAGASVRMHSDRDSAVGDANDLAARIEAQRGAAPYIIPFGGTTPMSTVGLVSGGLEIAGQVARGEMLAPDVVYVALGSMGTAVGVTLGMALGGLFPTVRAITVVPATIATEQGFRGLLNAVADLLHEADASIPADLAARVHVEVVGGFFGEGYALFTPAGMEAVHLAAALGDLPLEGTYTGKTMAALVAHGRAGRLAGQTVLFWDTFNSHDVASLRAGVDYHQLPEAGRAYFESAVQPLDQEED